MNYNRYKPRANRSRFYEPKLVSTKVNTIVTVVAFALFGAAAWYSITTTLDQQQAQHCAQGWQPACEKLK
jgi:hypothetical protein